MANKCAVVAALNRGRGLHNVVAVAVSAAKELALGARLGNFPD
jgi:hypothetical protein